MQQKCVNAVSQALGRQITKAEADGIQQRIAQALRELSRQDPQAFAAKSQAQRLQEAAKIAGDGLIAEAKLKQARASLQILAHQRINDYISGRVSDGMTQLDALDHLIAFDADMRGKTVSLESWAEGVNADLTGRLLDTLTATNPKWWGLVENADGVRDLIKEIRGEPSGNAQAKAGAKAWREVTEAARLRFNRAGGDVGKLDDWGMPQHHSQRLVAKAGEDKWVQDVTPLLDQANYFNPDGTRMSSAELDAFLRGAYQTIASGGANKLVPGQFAGTGARANRGSASRQIHFQDADSYLKYQELYGERSLYEVLTGHIEGISKDIALVEQFGPNPDSTFRYFRDKAVQEQSIAEPTKLDQVSKKAVQVENLYNVISGKTLPLASSRLAATFDTLRSWLVASRLGSAVITSFSDEGTLRLVARTNNLPQMQLLKNQLSTLNIANRAEERMAQRAGLGLRVMMSTLNRFGADSMRNTFSRKVAAFVIRAQGLTAITEARRRAFGVTMMGATGGVVRDHANLHSIDANDYRSMLSKGITEENFQIWKRAIQEDWGNGNDTMLTPESIYRIPDADIAAVIGATDATAIARAREQSVTRLLGMILEESDMAVIQPGVRERAIMGDNLQRGTWKGELTKSFFLFKSFPLAMITRHVRRGWLSDTAPVSRAAYLAGLVATTTVLGAVSLQVNEVLSGRDPRNLDPTESKGRRGWLAAMLKGGAMGLYGDFLFGESTRYGQTPLASLLGPVYGMAESTIQLTHGNVFQSLEGKDAHFGAEAVRYVKSNLPGANLWYTKAALDHMIFHQLQEYFSPGYLRKMQARSRKDFGQRYYWEPGDLTPDRGPDVTAVAGE